MFVFLISTVPFSHNITVIKYQAKQNNKMFSSGDIFFKSKKIVILFLLVFPLSIHVVYLPFPFLFSLAFNNVSFILLYTTERLFFFAIVKIIPYGLTEQIRISLITRNFFLLAIMIICEIVHFFESWWDTTGFISHNIIKYWLLLYKFTGWCYHQLCYLK